MHVYHREKCLKHIRSFYNDEEPIKAITGVRRCGKSCSGFPKAVECDSEENKRAYVQGVIQETFEKDVKRSNKKKNVSVFNAMRALHGVGHTAVS